MSNPKIAYDYPYRLRIEHPERADVRLFRAGRTIVFDPAAPLPDGAIVVLTGPAPDRVRGVAEAVAAGRRPTVLAAQELLDWLAPLGPVDGVTAPCELDGVRFEALPYAPPPPSAGPLARNLVASLGALRPAATLRHLRERARLPGGQPLVWHLTFPDRSRLLHLDLALHRGVTGEFVERAATAWGAPEWILVGSAWGEGDGVVQWLGRFGKARVLLLDLVNGERRAVGLPTELVTPLRDRLIAQGIDAHVFATEAGYRFE